MIGRTKKGNYGHGLDKVWTEIPQVEIIAVADEHPGGRAEVQRKIGAKSAYADYREMLDKEQLDIVCIAPRWPNQHRDMALAATEHGCHIYREKPFCRDMQEADEVVRACEMRHLKLAIAHTNRYSPTLDVVKNLIEQGEIGDVLEFRARGKEDDRRGGGEDLWVLGTHMLDLMRSLAGNVSSCYATVTQDGRPVTRADVIDGPEGLGPIAGDNINAMYTFENDTTGFFASHRDSEGRPTRFGIKVFGSKGIIEMSSGYLKTAYLLKHSSWSPGQTGAKWIPVSSSGVGQVEKKAAGHGEANIAAVTDLLDAIEHDRDPKSSVYDARAATEMIASVYESHRQRGPVSVPLENRVNPLTMLGE